MQSVEIQGRTIEEAVGIALGQLGQRREDVEIEVLRPGSPGVLGQGAEMALVRVTVRGAAPAGGYPQQPPTQQPYGGQPGYAPRPDYGNQGGGYGGGQPGYAPRPDYGNQGGGYGGGQPGYAPRPDYGNQGGGYGGGQRADYGQRPPQRNDYGQRPPQRSGYGTQGGYAQRPPQRGGYGNQGAGYGGGRQDFGAQAGYSNYTAPVMPPLPQVQQPPMPEAPNPQAEELAQIGRDFLINMMRRMHIAAVAEVEYTGVSPDEPETEDSDNTVVTINLSGSQDLAMLIGRRGESLTDIQFVFNLMMNKRTRQWGKVMIDVEGYRSRRKEQLVNLAKRMAEQVGTHRQPITLEPMPAYERRIIHIALLDHPYVRTESFGEGEDRKVTLFAK